MKALAIHDAQGTIQHFVIVPGNAPAAAVEAAADQLITEVDVRDVQIEASSAESLEQLVKTIQSHKVDMTRRDRLIRRG